MEGRNLAVTPTRHIQVNEWRPIQVNFLLKIRATIELSEKIVLFLTALVLVTPQVAANSIAVENASAAFNKPNELQSTVFANASTDATASTPARLSAGNDLVSLVQLAAAKARTTALQGMFALEVVAALPALQNFARTARAPLQITHVVLVATVVIPAKCVLETAIVVLPTIRIAAAMDAVMLPRPAERRNAQVSLAQTELALPPELRAAAVVVTAIQVKSASLADAAQVALRTCAPTDGAILPLRVVPRLALE
ncbi:hypothetical protein HDU83_005940 [Entophlyctis luteolus]|nr:hypothetical protein HDU83_005940 [Entophlyctis luteolus]KAJ3380202.1 hypothetical protein HDU84_006084 [Entophlyctis sp. JEL0112]